MNGYAKRYYSTQPLKVGEPVSLFQFLEPGADPSRLQGVSVKSFELIANNGEWFPAEVASAYRSFSRSKSQPDLMQFTGGHRIVLPTGNGMIHLSMSLELVQGMLTSSATLQLPGAKDYLPIDACSPYSHMLMLLELKMAPSHD